MTETSPKKTRPVTKKANALSYTGHLAVLRKALLISIGAVLVIFFVVLNLWTAPLIDFLLKPVVSRGVIVVATGVTESFMMQVKTSLVAAIILAMPVIIWQIGGFVWPALYKQEKKRFVLIFFVLIVLFAGGVVFAYTAVFPLAIKLFYESGLGHAQALWSIEGYFNFVLSFLIPFGLMFELPVVVYLLAKAGIVTSKAMNRARRYFILGASIVAAFLTPPDVVSQIFLLIPLLLLYELSALLVRFVKSAKATSDHTAA